MGDKRWASTRKSGMTVLGKVPKPLNLPSQRLENHGLDPNLEIVPKGTLTWGSRILSATPNAWASSASSSPNIDGGGGSPNNGRPTSTSSSDSGPRPSSSGSAPRPSTAGSENSHETSSNVWGSNSRPSSASGLLVSNQLSRIASRPRSAETRPGSSQLSRFAESVADNSVSWGSTKASNGVGTPTSRNDAFSLSSGDFPTLGSEKNSESRGHSSQGRPSSASSRTAAQKELLEGPEPPRLDQCSDHTNVNSWRNDGHQGGVGSPNLENWKREHQHTPPYSSVSMQHQQFEPWHGPPGPPVQPWHGPPGGPYRLPAPPGNFHAEPFAYYAPHMSATTPNSRGILRPAAGPGGYSPKDVESYPARLPPEPYMIQGHPMIQLGPGVYPVPVTYDGYFGAPLMDVNARPVLTNQYNQNANLVCEKFHTRHGPQEPLVKEEHKESDQSHGIRHGQYKFLLKHHDGREDEGGKEKIQQLEACSLPNVECDQDVISSMEGKTGSVKSVHQQKGSSDAASEPEVSLTLAKTADDRKELESTPVSASDKQNYPAVRRNTTLIEKIEGLNNKLRVVDHHTEGGSALNRGKTNTAKVVYMEGSQSSEIMSKNDALAESHTIAIPKPVSELGSEPSEPQAHVQALLAASEHGKFTHSQHKGLMQGRAEYDIKSNLNSKDDNGWIKKSSFRDSQGMTTEATPVNAKEESSVDSHESGQEIMRGHSSLSTVHAGRSYTASPVDVIDHQSQRAKMKEIAIQRVKQLQREEEERAREQKAKALAKLEELNRRTSAFNQSVIFASEGNNINHGQDPGLGTSAIAASLTEAADAVGQSNSEGKTPEEIIGLSPKVASEPSESDVHGPAGPNVSSSKQELEPSMEYKSSQRTHNSNIPKQKHAGYRRRQINSNESNIAEKPVATVGMENPENPNEVVPDQHPSTAGVLPIVEEQESSSQHRKKNYRGSRNKNRLEGTSMAPALPSSEHFKGKYDHGIVGSKLRTSQATPETISIASQNDSQTVINQASCELTVISAEKQSLVTTKEQHGRSTNQWKPQPPRKSARNNQVQKQIGKFHVNETAIWAPVKSANKSSPAEETNENGDVNECSDTSAMNLQDVQNGMRTKRADIERYVPKNAAKELAPAEKSQLPSCSYNQTDSSNYSVVAHLDSQSPENCMAGQPGVGKIPLSMDTRIWEDNKPNRRGKMHTSWRQRHSSSPMLLEETNGGPVSSDITRNISEHVGKIGSTKIGNLPERLQKSDGLISSTDNVTPGEPDALDVATKARGGTSRHHYQQLKTHKVGGSNHGLADNEEPLSVKDKHSNLSPYSNLNESDISSNSRVENNNNRGDHMRSNWQLKSQTSQNHMPKSRGKEDQTVIQQRNNFGENKKGHHEGFFKGEGMVTTEPSKKQTYFPNKAPDTDLVSTCLHGQPESSVNSTHQKKGQHSSHFTRGEEALYRGRDRGHSDSKHNFHANASKRRNGSHYEYQKIVSYDKPCDSFQQNQAGEEAEGVPHSHGSNYRDRGGHQYPRRGGHFYERSRRSGVRVNDSHDNAE